jgi:hypothetical protein
MGTYRPKPSAVPDGKRIKDDKLKTEQVSTYLPKYQIEWLRQKRENETYNLAEDIRLFIDSMIANEELDIPQSCLMDEEEFKEDRATGIEVFASE